MIPDRIVVNKSGEARPPKPGSVPLPLDGAIFIRKDGWSIAAKAEFEDVAFNLWPDEWFAFTTPEDNYRILPIEEYLRRHGR